MPKSTISAAWQYPKYTSNILNINRYTIFIVLIQAVNNVTMVTMLDFEWITTTSLHVFTFYVFTIFR